jgi:hypothetical protein
MTSARWTDLVDESDQVRVGRRLVEILATRRLPITRTADAAESRNRFRAVCVHVLVLCVSSHPGDDDVVFVAECEMHAPGSIEAPLANTVIGARLGPHAGAASLAVALSKLIDHPIEALLDLAAQRLDARLTAATLTLNCDAITTPGVGRPCDQRSTVSPARASCRPSRAPGWASAR